jgi:hypothetical protein
MHDSHMGMVIPLALAYQLVAACMVLYSTRLVMFWRYLTTHMEVKALALSTRDHTESPPSFLGSFSVALATLGMPLFQMKDCTMPLFF